MRRAQKKQELRQEQEQIRAEVKKVLRAKKPKGKVPRTAAREEEPRAKAKASREQQEQQEYQKWEAYWKQKAPPGAQAPPWTFSIPLYEKGVEVTVR